MSIMINNENNKFCKVCYDANKSIEEYTSHFVKDKPGQDGTIICPLLLSQKCLFCNEYGHTIKYCTLKRCNKNLFNSPPKIIFENHNINDNNDNNNCDYNEDENYYNDKYDKQIK